MELPLPIDEEIWGEIIYMEMYAPGLWFMESNASFERPCRGADVFYVVSAPYSGGLLSPEALKYGEEIEGLLYFDYDHGKLIIDYELLRTGRENSATRRNGRTHSIDQSLKDLAAIGSEQYPAYFGPMPIPQVTPFGPVTRCRPLQNGVYLVESGAKQILSLSYPVWDDLKFDTLALAQWNEKTQKQASQNCGAAFFSMETCAPAIYDLLFWGERYQALSTYIQREALIAALWDHHPSLVALRNTEVDSLVENCEPLSMDSGADQESLICIYEQGRIPTPTTSETNFLHLTS